MVTLAKQVEALMKLRQITQADLAKKSGMHRANLCRYLAGETDIRVTSLVSLLSALDIDCEQVLGREILRLSDSAKNEPVHSLGEALEILLANLDPLTSKTFLKTLILRGQGLPPSPPLSQALERIQSHHRQPPATTATAVPHSEHNPLDFVEPT